MLLTVRDFKHRVAHQIDGLVHELQDVTGRVGSEEAAAWRSSLPAVAHLLSTPALDPVHVFFQGRGHVSLEYPLPAAPSWCDLVLLGAKQGRPSALVMELKHWDTSGDIPGPTEGLMLRAGVSALHPSRQVGNYTDYIRRFHSEVLDRDALVSGCVFFTRSGSAGMYSAQPNHLLASNFPIFTTHTTDVDTRFPQFATNLLTEPSTEFAQAFEAGTYKQDRGFVRQIAQQVQDPTRSPFVLLDNQDKAFLECRERVRGVVDRRDGAERKHVVVVHGPPGSGKSVVAARLWAALVTDGATQDGNIVVTTTSASQNSNWVHLVEQAARMSGSRGVVKKATDYTPASLPEVQRLEKKFGQEVFKDPLAWKDNLTLLRSLMRFRPGSEDNTYLVSIVDEAHALINPEHPAGRAGPLGFVVSLGPQAWHIIRASRLAIFFMDGDQGFRDRENTTVADLRNWAAEQNASFDEISLGGLQFRCAGSKEYTDWIEIIRTNTHPQIAARHAVRWRSNEREEMRQVAMVAEPRAMTYHKRGRMRFDIVDTPAELEAVLRYRHSQGHTVRLLASFAHQWKTKDVEAPHQLPAELKDFQIPYKTASGEPHVWARVWNVVVKNDYTGFVQGTSPAMSADPLCEVGCPYVVRGFDFDYVGIIWSRDLLWRRDSWMVDLAHVEETGTKKTLQRARKERPPGPVHADLLNRVWQAYRILLTRAICGVVLYVEDDETRRYLATACGTATSAS